MVAGATCTKAPSAASREVAEGQTPGAVSLLGQGLRPKGPSSIAKELKHIIGAPFLLYLFF